MAEYRTIRINFKKWEYFENYRRMETLAIIRGMDINALVGEMFTAKMLELSEVVPLSNALKGILDAVEFKDAVEEEFGIDLTRKEFMQLREKFFESGRDFYTGWNGDTAVFRYNVERCLPKIREYLRQKVK